MAIIKYKDFSIDTDVKTAIMGILNVTPDSFSDGGKYNSLETALERAKVIEEEGADILDIGAESTRPGSEKIDSKTELERLLPILENIKEVSKLPISIDTYKAKTAEECLKKDAWMINDIWGLQHEDDMARVVADFGCPICIMHNHIGVEYEKNIIEEIKIFLEKSIEIALKSGIKEDKIILDPGVGFGKTLEHNLEIVRNLYKIKELGFPTLLGTSRKSMFGLITGLPADKRVNATLATTALAISQDTDIVRVHDIRENFEVAQVCDTIYQKGK